MSSDFQDTTIGKLVQFSNGRSSPERYEDGKYPVFGSNGLIGKANETNAPPSSIVVGRVGSYCGSVHFSQQPCWVTDNAIKAIAKDRNNPEFLFYLLKHLDLNNWRSGSGQPLINQATLNAIEVCVPEPEEQREIGQFVGSLDDRITLLRETNATLEAIAQALFKSWFVDFDPVRAKMEGRIPEGMDEDTARLFPDALEESELGLVPRGWNIGNVSSLASEVTARVGTKPAVVLSAIQTGSLIRSAEHFTKRVHSEDITKYKTVMPNSFAYNPSRINIGSIGMNELNEVGAVSPIYVVIMPTNIFKGYLLWHHLRTNGFKAKINTILNP